EELASTILSEHSKDLRVAIFLTEARLKRNGFAGLREGLGLLHSLIIQYWDRGLHPAVEDGDLQYRARPLEWLNAKMPQALFQVPLLKRNDGGENYSYARFSESRRVGYEKDTHTSDGDGGYARREQRLAALTRGEISAEMFDAAVSATN